MSSPLMMGSLLSGRVALVTGAGSGIGRACAQTLAAEGASVGLVGRTADALLETQLLISADGCSAYSIVADVTDPEAVRDAVAAVLRQFDRIDVLVNSAGTNTARRSLALTAPADWERVVSTNLTGVFLMTQAVLAPMREQHGGTIINISSLAGKGAVRVAGVAYSASKLGVTALTQMVNLEEWQHGIRATTLFPGETLTPLLLRRPVRVPDEHHALILQPEDVGRAVAFIATQPARVLIEELLMRPVLRKEGARE